MQCRLFLTNVLPCGENIEVRRQVEDRWRTGGQLVTNLGVEACGGVQEQLAELVHPVGVAGGVFQTGEEPTADSHGAAQTSGHISCKHTNMLHTGLTELSR